MANRHRSVDSSDGLEKCNLQAMQISGAPHHLFTSAGIQKRWAPRISLLLDIPLEKQDNLSSQICSRCCANRVESLEKAFKDLIVFKAMARCYLDRVTGFKRTKETSSDVGVSPDTISDRLSSKVAKRLAQAVLLSISSCCCCFKAYWTASEKADPRARADPLDIVCINKPQVLELGLYGIASLQ